MNLLKRGESVQSRERTRVVRVIDLLLTSILIRNLGTVLLRGKVAKSLRNIRSLLVNIPNEKGKGFVPKMIKSINCEALFPPKIKNRLENWPTTITPVLDLDQERGSPPHVPDLEIIKERPKKDRDLVRIPETEETVDPGLNQSLGRKESVSPPLLLKRCIRSDQDREAIQSQNGQNIVLAPKKENKVNQDLNKIIQKIVPDQIMERAGPRL